MVGAAMQEVEEYARNLAMLVEAGWSPEDAVAHLEACMSVDEKQEGGNHYKSVPPDYQHWNLVIMHGWNYFQAQAIKYLMRYKDKNGVEDLKKALHFVEKMIEMETPKVNKEVQLDFVPVKPKATDYLVFVKPTGWEYFTFEGADASGFRYRCQKCREEITIPQFAPPHAHHLCHEAPPGWRPR
jgi:hypothetical protein